MKVTIWRCTESCGNYYASSSSNAPDLRTEMNHRSSMNNGVGDTPYRPTHSRATCPNCKKDRQPLFIEIPGSDAVTPVDHGIRDPVEAFGGVA